MQSRSLKLTIKLKKGQNDSISASIKNDCPRSVEELNHSKSSTSGGVQQSTSQEPGDVASLEREQGEEREEREENHDQVDEENQSSENAQKQLVLYDPSANGTSELEPVPDPNEYQSPPFARHPFSNHTSRVLPSVGAFTVQCANCFKWRLIPTKEKYEEIREHILEQPFFCETAREWRTDISCDDPPDITQDGSRLWAIDKPNIAQPPPGWQRLLRIRGEGGTKFADVYYVAPSGKRLRSMVEIQKYLNEHPEYMDGVSMSQFSFQVPRPLQENYVKKRPARLENSDDSGYHGMPASLDPSEVNPIAWIGPEDDSHLPFRGPGISTHFSSPESQRAKKKRTPSKRRSSEDLVSERNAVKGGSMRSFMPSLDFTRPEYKECTDQKQKSRGISLSAIIKWLRLNASLA